MSLPKIKIPPPEIALLEDIDPLYRRIFKAYSHTTELVYDNLYLPRASGLSSEDFASENILNLLQTMLLDRPPNILMDCRSSAAIGGAAPTYKLVDKIGLNRILPICVSGQSGAEIPQALILIKPILERSNDIAIISGTQRMVTPDTRIVGDQYPLADSTVAFLVSEKFQTTSSKFKILGVEITQVLSSLENSIESIIQCLLKKANVSPKQVSWSICHRVSDEFERQSEKILHSRFGINSRLRSQHQNINFGCTDPLITISNVFTEQLDPPKGIGIVVFLGRFSTIGGILLDVTAEYEHLSDKQASEVR